MPPFHRLPPETSGINRLLMSMLSKRMMERPRAPQILGDPCLAENEATQQTPLPQKLRSRHERATAGITLSFLAGMDNEEFPAIAALKELHNTLHET